jgi:DNA (cytosine-5)-methyltransferase 1
MSLRVLDLFSGIGGFSLGLERAGMKTVAFCEIDLFCRRVLAKHWPEVPCYDDVRTLTAARLAADGIIKAVADAASTCTNGHASGTLAPYPLPRNIGIGLICGGFPCQDISVAGKGAGIGGARSGLWSEYARIISEVRPRYVIVENVAALLGRGLARVLGDLAALGFDAEWHCIPASAVGAPHRRDRVWIIGYEAVADAVVLNGHDGGYGASKIQQWFAPILSVSEQWQSEPDVGRVANWISNRVDRLRSLGNAVVPQIPELIGRAILKADNA